MRVLFTSFPAVGHLLPMLPLAHAAGAAGDEVLVSAHADLRPLVGDLPFQACGPSLTELMAESDRRTQVDLLADDVVATREAGVALFTSLRAELALDECVELARARRPDLIVAEMWDFVAPLVAAALDVPFISFVHSPDTPIDGPLADGLRASFEQHELSPVAPRARIVQWPDWLQPEGHVTGAGELETGFAPLPDGASPGRPATTADVLVSLGTAVVDRDLLVALVTAARDAGASVVATTLTGIAPGSFDVDPDRISMVGFTPIDDLLRRVAAVVIHGGSGTTLAALRRARPIVFVPQFANQPVIADVVAADGAGIVSADPAGVAAAVRTVLDDPAYAEAAGRAAAALARRPSPERTWAAVRDRLR